MAKTSTSTKTARKAQAASSPYWFSMSHAERLGTDNHIASMLPIIFFGAIVILIVRAASYTRDMESFYWTNESGTLTDFFSYDKMILILILAAITIFIFLYRALTATMSIKKTWLYVPMGIYAFFVLVSYAACDYKEFSILGFNDRFEGTLVILAYLVMLFYIINAVNSEKNARTIMWAVGVSCALLCLLGFTQGTGHDFFRTTFGKKLITPSAWWNDLDSLNFTFNNNEIYQTVFNINYVSFYLALVIPAFALLMIHALNHFKESKYNKVTSVLLVLLFAAFIFNLAGSKSTGGLVGLGVAFLAALVLFNKRLLKWWKSVGIMLLVMVVMLGATSSMWFDEVASTLGRTLGAETVSTDADTADSTESTTDDSSTTTSNPLAGATVRPYIDYIITDGYTIKFSVEGNEIDLGVVISEAGELETIDVTDADGNLIEVTAVDVDGATRYAFDDDRYFDYINLSLTQDEEGNLYVRVATVDRDWYFAVQADGVYYRNGFGNMVTLDKIPAYGFKNNQQFGSGRGYIWSRAFGMLADDFFIGDGADTFCIYYPHNDYAGKYNAGWENLDLIVDKPHNMYIAMFQGTSGISMLAFIAIVIMYLAGTLKVLRRSKYESWLEYAAAGIFLGVIGFAIAGIFNDSTVSTMPLFYTILGTGVAIDILLADRKRTEQPADGLLETKKDKKKDKAAEKKAEKAAQPAAAAPEAGETADGAADTTAAAPAVNGAAGTTPANGAAGVTAASPEANGAAQAGTTTPADTAGGAPAANGAAQAGTKAPADTAANAASEPAQPGAAPAANGAASATAAPAANGAAQAGTTAPADTAGGAPEANGAAGAAPANGAAGAAAAE